MKKDLHPKYEDTTVKCACGKEWDVKSTKKSAKVGICSSCHPFFTGKDKVLDTDGRIDKFKKRYANLKKA